MMWQKWNSTQRVIAILAGTVGFALAAVLVLLLAGLLAPRLGGGNELAAGVSGVLPESPIAMPEGVASVGANGSGDMGLEAARRAEMDTLSRNEAPAEAEMKVASSAMKDASTPGRRDVPVSGPVLKPQLIKEANVTLKVEKLASAVKRIRQLATGLGGYVTMENLNLSEDKSAYRAGSMTVRLPEAQLDRFLEAANGVGKVLNETISAQDVSRELVDTESRIRNLQAEEKALQQIMGRAGKIPEVLEVARELGRVRGEIEAAQGSLSYMRGQVAYSTVNLNITEKMVTPAINTQPGIGDTAFNSLQKAWSALYGAILQLINMAVWLCVFLLPVLLALSAAAWAIFHLLACGFTFCRRRCAKSSKPGEGDGP